MTLGAYLKSYFKQCLDALKHPKQLLPTFILAAVWMLLGIVQNKVQANFPLRVLNFLTFAQGGLYGGIFGAVGGMLGKIVMAAFVNVMIVPLFYKKNPFANLKSGLGEVLQTSKVQGTEAISSLLKGIGAALLLYSIFNTTQSRENSMVGIVSAVALVSAVARKGGFLWGLVLSWINTVSKGKAPSQMQVMRALSGMSLGFTLGVVLSTVGSMWAGSLGFIALIVAWLMGRGSKKEAAAHLLLMGLFLLPQAELHAQSTKGKWSLVDVETEVNPTATSHDMHGKPLAVKLSGTTASYRMDYVYGEETGYYTGSITPFLGSYAPGYEYSGESKARCEQGTRWLDLVLYNWNYLWLSYLGGEEKKARIGWEMRDDLGPFTYKFPTLEEVGSDRFTITEEVKVFDAFIRTMYSFEWNTKKKVLRSADTGETVETEEWDDIEIALPDWIDKLFGASGEHAPDVTTVLVGILGALGGLGGAVGGLGGAGVPPAGGMPPEPEPKRDPTPEELRRKQYVHDNPDGTKTYYDPATGEKHTLYPQYNPETGEPSGWKNEWDTPYTQESLDDWLAWRERNSEHFNQDAKQARQWREDQRAANDARNEADRQRGSSDTADKYKEEKLARQNELKHELYVDKVASQLGMSSDDEEALDKALKREMHKNYQEANENELAAAAWDERIAQAEFVESVADNTINVLGETNPAAKQIKNAYNFAKPVTKSAWEGLAKHKDATGMAKSIGKGLIEGGLNVVQNEAGNSELWGSGLLDKATGGYGGRTVGAEVLKSVCKDLLDDEPKSWSEITDNATKVGVQRIGYEVTNKIMGKLGSYATDGTEEGVNQVVSFGTEMHSQTVANPIADEIADGINKFRTSTLGF